MTEVRQRALAVLRSGAAVALALHVGVVALQIAILNWMSTGDNAAGVKGRLTAWDAAFYIGIAKDGYERSFQFNSDGQIVGGKLAFFPLYPLVVRAVALLPWIDYTDAALLVSWISAAVAAVLIYLLGARLYSHRVGLVLSVLFSAQPMSVVFSMAYSEALFCALALGALLAAHSRAWLLTGVLGFAAGLTRSSGLALAAALFIAVLMTRPGKGERFWHAPLALLATIAGVPLYWAWVGMRLGRWDAWFVVERAWETQWDWGLTTMRFVRDTMRGGEGWVGVSVALMLITVLIGLVIAGTERVWPPLVAYGTGVALLVLGSTMYFHSKPRLLLPVIVIWIPVAVLLARLRTPSLVVALAGFALFGCWYGSHMLTVWHYAI